MISIEAAGLRATVQDAGRFRYLRHGVPVSGPADRVAHAAANALVGNDPGAAAIEITGLPFVFRTSGALLVAVTGPGTRIVARHVVDGWTACLLRADGEVRLEGAARYAYLAVRGAVDVPAALGSRSAYPAAGIGPRPLHAGDTIRMGEADLGAELAGRTIERPDYASGIARAVAGPHSDRTDAPAFFASEFVVDERSDRMGVRLTGSPVPTRGGELLTCGMVEGAVQIPSGGQPIVLLADHQTTGGYPVVATVIAADLPIVAQRPPGAALRFVEASTDEAVAALQRARLALADRGTEGVLSA